MKIETSSDVEPKEKPPDESPPVLTEEQFQEYVQLLSRAPGEYWVHLDEESYLVREQAYVNGLHDLRSKIVKGGVLRRLGPRPLGIVLLELAASLLARSMSRETFEKNARLWYDSVRLDAPSFTANARGGES